MNTRGSSTRTIVQINDDDVVLGIHGAGSYTKHYGNVQYRVFILRKKDAYQLLKNRSNEKVAFPEDLKVQFHTKYPNARFLLYDNKKKLFEIADSTYVVNSIHRLLHRKDTTNKKQNGKGRKRKYSNNNKNTNSSPKNNNKKRKSNKVGANEVKDTVSGVKSIIIPEWLSSFTTSHQTAMLNELDNVLAYPTRIPWSFGSGQMDDNAPRGIPVTCDSPLGPTSQKPFVSILRHKYTIAAQYSSYSKWC